MARCGLDLGGLGADRHGSRDARHSIAALDCCRHGLIIDDQCGGEEKRSVCIYNAD